MPDACERCGGAVVRRSTRGPAPRYCSAACRQRAYEKRQDARAATDRQTIRDIRHAWTAYLVAETPGQIDRAFHHLDSMITEDP